jgi:histidyl-tRNA synthetase
MKNIQSLRGMNDILDLRSEKYIYFTETASKIARNYGFKYIETPLLEETALFKRSVGESSDIVGKEMYNFTDKGKNEVCLRPEGTAGVVRSFVQNKFDRKFEQLGEKQKFFYFGAMFRYERPQKGRLRLFHQFGAESFGESSYLEDASIILMIRDILNAFDIKFKLKLNSLGCDDCMPKYRENLVNFLNSKKDDLCEDCHRRIDTNPIRTLDCKVEKCQESLQDSPKITDNLCNSCDSDFENLKNILNQNNISFEVDRNLVRGLDYYTQTAFEFVVDGIGAQNAIAGGGRYNKLVEYLGGKNTPAVGFAIGIERILDLIELPQTAQKGYYFGVLDENQKYIESIFNLASQKRTENIPVHIELKKKSLKSHLKNADKMGFQYCAVIGENEFNSSTIWVKDLIGKFEDSHSIDSF